jgi:O-antigen/teichoic acid export membrane protein
LAFSIAPSANKIAGLRLRLTAAPGDALRARLVASAGWSIAGAVAARALPLAGMVVASRILGPDAFGQLGILQSTVALFAMLSGLGLGLTATRFIAATRTTDPRAAGEYAALAIWTTAAAGLVMALTTALAAPWLAAGALGAPELTPSLRIAAGVVAFVTLNGALLGILSGLEAFRGIAIAGAVQGAAAAALIVGGTALAGVEGGAVALVGAEACGVLAYAIMVRHATRRAGIPLRRGSLADAWPVLVRFSLPALLCSASILPAIWLGNVLLVRRTDGLAEMGIFAAANRWSLAVLFIPTAVGRIVLPMLANLHGVGDEAGYRRIFRANLMLSLGLTAVPALLLAALAAPVMALSGGEFRAGWPVLAILALATVPIALNDVLGQVVVSAGTIWWRLGFDLLLATILVVAAVTFVPVWGAVGLGLAYLLAYGVTSVGLTVLIARVVGPVKAGSAMVHQLSGTDPAGVAAFGRAASSAARGRGLFGPLLLAWCALLVFALASPDHRFVAALPGALVFALVLALCPRVRPVLATPICPLNWVLLLFFLRLVVLPLWINVGGPDLGTLPRLPSDGAINGAILLCALAFASFGIAYQRFSRPPRPRPDRPRRLAGRPPHRPLAIACAALGLVGFALTFPSPASLIAYYAHPAADALQPNDAPATLAEAAATFLRPFLGFAVVLVWCNWIDRRGKSSSRIARVGFTAVALALVVAAFASFDYNRGAFLAPAIAMAAVYGIRVRRISAKVLATAGALLLLVLLAWGLYRTSQYGGLRQVLTDPAARASLERDLNAGAQLQVYGGSPQFSALLLESIPMPEGLYRGRTLLGSLLSPLPILGEPFRGESGFFVYNRLYYGSLRVAYDQVIPFSAELFINFHLPGVIVGYAALGFAIARLQRAATEARSAIEVYVAQYAAYWLAFLIPGSLAVASQIFIYFFWPIYLYLFIRWIGPKGPIVEPAADPIDRCHSALPGASPTRTGDACVAPTTIGADRAKPWRGHPVQPSPSAPGGYAHA